MTSARTCGVNLLIGLKEFNGTEVDEVEVFGTFGGDLSAVSRP
ncbi:MAG: hypothetical protein K0Q81_681 [Paenibacillus sp.]|nr:hypothetical protein [Paenibacillus sp.]